MFDKEINKIREGLKPGMIKQVNVKDPRILIFKKVDFDDLKNNEEYYYPINKNAYNYLQLKYKEYKKDQLKTIEYTIFNEDEKANLTYQVNLIGVLLEKIKLKKRGVLNVDNDLLIYFNTEGEPTAINTNSEEKQDQLNKLVTKLPEITKDIWKKLETNIEDYI
jgi:hypothetical protein